MAHMDSRGGVGRSWKVAAGCVVAAGILALGVCGAQNAQAFTGDGATTGEEFEQNLDEKWADIASEYAPKVTELDDGTLIQRTPGDTSYFQMYYVNGGNLSYNTKYLDADSRGCNSCHDDLAQTLLDGDFFHLELDNGLGTTTTVDDCRICHDYGYGYMDKQNQLGTLIHGIHQRSGVSNDCMACHTATSDGQGMQLWDDVKHDVLQGISSVSDVEGTLTYDQTTTYGMPDASWYYTEQATSSIAKGYVGEDNPDSTFDTWDFTVSGLVKQPFTESLADLIAEAEAEGVVKTDYMALQCIMNAFGGEVIGNIEFTGIPISWLIEKAGGLADGADPTAIMSYAPDGWCRPATWDTLEENGGYLIYKIGGENLDWENGFPCMTAWPSFGIPAAIRWCSEISVIDTPVSDLKMWKSWTLSDGEVSNNEHNGGHGFTSDESVTTYNLVNLAFTNLKEGQIVESGECTFEGYAWGTDETLATIEFSLDGGNTWTAFDVSDSDKTKWVYWHFTTNLDPGAYVLQVRATTVEGTQSYQADEVMVNVKTAEDIDAIRASLHADDEGASESDSADAAASDTDAKSE